MREERPPEVSVVLVNYNDRAHLVACLDSLRPCPALSSREIILVDNASTDGSADFVAREYAGVRLIRNEANAGFGRASNQGARAARGESILFLNTDTVVAERAIGDLVAALKEDPRAGAAGPALFLGQGKFQVSFGKRVDFAAQLVQKSILNPYYKLRLPRLRSVRRAGWLSAACLLCRREAFEGVGGFDEEFFIYFEDIDLCVRMRKAGWSLLFVPEARVFHEGGATTAPRSAWSRLEYRRSQLRFYGRHSPGASLRLLRLSLRLHLLALAVKGRFRSAEGRRLREGYRSLLAKGKAPRANE
jgi:GT2 family glycosyltransferase